MATVRFAFKTLHGSAEIRFNWGQGEDIVSQSHVLKTDGIYEISLTHTWKEASAAEIQIWLARPAFDGWLEVLSCTIEPVMGAHEPAGGSDRAPSLPAKLPAPE